MSTSRDGPSAPGITASARPSNLLIAERQARSWSRDRLVIEFEQAATQLGVRAPERSAMAKAIYRHETGRAELRDEIYVQLYCAVYDLRPHELLGAARTGEAGPSTCTLTSHRFVPIRIDADGGTDATSQVLGLTPSTALGVVCDRGSVPRADGPADLYVFPWGVAVFHLADTLTVPNLSAVAAWRRRTCAPTQAWASDVIRTAVGSAEPTAHYVMSAFWLDSPPWSGPTLTTAMRLLAKPRVLLGRPDNSGEPSAAHAEQTERMLLRDGFHDGRIDDFGIQGISVGCATWGGVSYCPLSAPRALPAAAIIELESVVQALWCFCHHLREQVERGDDPAPASGYGWRWLRAMQSRLTVARPNESGQHVALRESVLAASGLADHLATAVALRDIERG